MSNIEIELDQADFQGGDEVKGRVVLTLDGPIPSRAIRVRFHGYERAHWVRGYGKNGSPNWETRTLFDEERTLHGRPPLSASEVIKDAIHGLFSRDQYEILDTGTHVYPFDFRLPQGLPGDYESPKASTIRYEVTAYVDIPLKVDLTNTRSLTVYESYDPEKIEPVHAEASKTFLLDGDAPLDVSLLLERNMFHPGDEVACIARLHNASSRKVEGLELTLVQIEELRAQELTETERFDMPMAHLESLNLTGDEPQEFPLTFVIPKDLYASITSSELVRVGYALVLKANVSWGGDCEVQLPILLLEELGMPSGVTLNQG